MFCTLGTYTAVMSSYATVALSAVIEFLCHLLFSSWWLVLKVFNKSC